MKLNLTMFGINSFCFGFNVLAVLTGHPSIISWIALGLTGFLAITLYVILLRDE